MRLGLLARAAFALGVAVTPALAHPHPGWAEEMSTPEAARAHGIVDRMEKAMGGRERFEKIRGLAFTFEVTRNDTVRTSRRHQWDRSTGWHRVEGKNRQGQAFLVMHDLDDSTATARAWVAGVALEGDSLRHMVDRAAFLWRHDTYWLLAPWKLRDPGTVLTWTGSVTRDGVAFDQLKLVFQPPADRFWFNVDPRTKLVTKWEFWETGWKDDERERSTWEGWEKHDGVLFATRRVVDEHTTLRMRDLATVRAFAPGTFEKP